MKSTKQMYDAMLTEPAKPSTAHSTKKMSAADKMFGGKGKSEKMAGGGCTTKKYAKGGMIDGCATKGKTKGRMV